MAKAFTKEQLNSLMSELKMSQDIQRTRNYDHYDIFRSKPTVTTCEECGILHTEEGLRKPLFIRIPMRVAEIRELGYDAFCKYMCYDCAKKLRLNPQSDSRLHYVFFFKAEGEEQYTISISNHVDDYAAILAFLRQEPIYNSVFEEQCPVKREANTICEMLGLGEL